MENCNGETEQVDNKEKPKFNIMLIIFAGVFGVINYFYVSFLHENHVTFSHLSSMEREIFFRTENGFYYSYYKQLIHSKSLSDAFQLLIKDNLTEYPTVINSFERFNIYPEVIVAAMYKIFIYITKTVLNYPMITCYVMEREGLPTTTNCDGMGDPAIFYTQMIFLLNGAMMFCIFIAGWMLGGYNRLAGVTSCLMVLYNHRECTRIQWNSPLRENFSFPFIVMQQMILISILKSQSHVKLWQRLLFIVSSIAAVLSWQFAQFAFTTQIAAIYMTYLIGSTSLITTTNWSSILWCYAVIDVVTVTMQFGNSLLLIGPFRSCYISALLLVYCEPNAIRQKFTNSIFAPIRWLGGFIVLLICTVIGQHCITQILNLHSDNHMWDILRSKFSNFRSFDSLIYTCAPEFDFYDLKSIKSLISTGLLIVCVVITIRILADLLTNWIKLIMYRNSDWIKQHRCIWIDSKYGVDCAMLYVLFQSIAYTILAMLIMRLKLFFTSQLCIMSAIMFNYRLWIKPINLIIPENIRLKFPYIKFNMICVVILAMSSIQGFKNLRDELSISGVYSNWPQEQLLSHIHSNMNHNASFAGQMGLMATVRLVTGRPVTLHPHYEDWRSRFRVKLAYSIYSRKSIEEVWRLLKHELLAEYLIYQLGYCQIRPDKPDCSFFAMWDTIDPRNKLSDPVCYRFDEAIYRRGYRGGRGHLDGEDAEFYRYFQLEMTTDDMTIAILKIL